MRRFPRWLAAIAALALAPAALLAALRPDQVPLEGRLFEIKIARFNRTKDTGLLEQYFRKNIVNHRKSPGAFLETVEHNRTRVLKDFSKSKRRKLMAKWLDGLEKDHPDLGPSLDAARLYNEWTYYAERSAPLTDEMRDALRTKVVEALDKVEVSAWTQLAAGLIVDLVGVDEQGGPDESGDGAEGEPREADPDQLPSAIELWDRASEGAGNLDAHLHFLLGDLLSLVVDPSVVPVYCKKVATEFEKALLIKPSDKQLYGAVAGRYHEIYERLSEDSDNLPFWFEELVFKRLIAVEPTNARAHNNLSFLYSQYGVNLKEALKEAQIANQLEPGDPNLMDTLGWAYYKAGNPRKAVAILRKALEIDDSVADVHFHLATILYDMHQYDEAIEHFRTTVELDPENAFAFNNLAYLFSERNIHLKEGLELVDKALELKPESSAFLDTKGWLFFRLGRYDEAAAFVEKAIALQPEVGELHMHAGQIALAQGRYRFAADHFEKALTYDPQNRGLGRQLARVYALDGLKRGLSRFSRIHSVQKNPRNFEAFYRAMSEIYQTDGLYDESIAALQRYRDLPTGGPVGPTSPPPGVEVAPEGPTPGAGAAVTDGEVPESTENLAAAIQSLPPSTDMVITVEHPGLVGLLDMVIEHVRLPISIAPFRDSIAARLPRRVVVGFDATVDDEDEGAHNVALLQVAPESLARLAAIAQARGNTKIAVPGTKIQVPLTTWTYKDHQLGTIGAPGMVMHYAFLPDALALSQRKSTLIALLDRAPADAPKMTGIEGFADFIPRVSPGAHALLIGDVAALLQGTAGEKLADDERAFLAHLALICSQYTLNLPADTLTEDSSLYPAGGAPLTDHPKQAAAFAQRSIAKFPGAELLQVQTDFTAVDGRVQGEVVVQGVQKWLKKLLGRVSKADVDLPDLDIHESGPEDAEGGDEGPGLEIEMDEGSEYDGSGHEDHDHEDHDPAMDLDEQPAEPGAIPVPMPRKAPESGASP